MYQSNPRNYGGRDQRPSVTWTKGYKIFENGKLNLAWVSEHAQEFSQALCNDRLTGTQLRAFYNEFIRIRDIQSADMEKAVLIKLLEAKIRYRKTAHPRDIPNIMVDFISNLVSQIGTDMARFEQACYVMEAIVGFFPKNK